MGGNYRARIAQVWLSPIGIKRITFDPLFFMIRSDGLTNGDRRLEEPAHGGFREIYPRVRGAV